MKKQLLLPITLFSAFAANAQNDTLIWADFNTDPTYIQIALPLGNPTDTSWYTFDMDGQPDGSSAGRPGEWFWSAAYSDSDTLNNAGVLGSSSWTNSSTPTENVLITPSIMIVDANAVLSWKSAPYQTPRYLDGYQVLVAISNNDPSAFTDTLFVASEYVSLDNQSFPNAFSSYTFAPAPTSNPLDPFVHGMDSTYTELDPASDSSRLIGRLRPFSVSLAQYSGQTIDIMFNHKTVDDNLISVDDILVTGTDPTGVGELNPGLPFSTYPNPANDQLNIRYTLPGASPVSLNIYDVSGKLVSAQNFGTIAAGPQQQTIDVSALPAGFYHVELVTEMGKSNNKVIVH